MSAPANTRWQAVVWQHMGRYLPPGQGRHLGRAAFDNRVHAEPGERLSAPVEEDGVIGGPAVDQFDHDALDLRPQGALAHLSALSVQDDERVAAIAASDLQVAHPKLRGLRHARSGPVEEQQDRVFDPPVPCRAVGHVPPRNYPAIAVDDHDIAMVAGPGDRALALRQFPHPEAAAHAARGRIEAHPRHGRVALRRATSTPPVSGAATSTLCAPAATIFIAVSTPSNTKLRD